MNRLRLGQTQPTPYGPVRADGFVEAWLLRRLDPGANYTGLSDPKVLRELDRFTATDEPVDTGIVATARTGEPYEQVLQIKRSTTFSVPALHLSTRLGDFTHWIRAPLEEDGTPATDQLSEGWLIAGGTPPQPGKAACPA